MGTNMLDIVILSFILFLFISFPIYSLILLFSFSTNVASDSIISTFVDNEPFIKSNQQTQKQVLKNQNTYNGI